jgi:hypothetical protein
MLPERLDATELLVANGTRELPPDLLAFVPVIILGPHQTLEGKPNF